MAEVHHSLLRPLVEPFFFKWTLEKYSYMQKMQQPIISNIYSNGLYSHNWKLQLDLVGDGIHNSIYLQLASRPRKTVTSSLKFTIKSATGNDFSRERSSLVIFSSYYSPYSYRQASRHGYPEFIALKELHDGASHLLPNDTLTIICQGEILKVMEEEEIKHDEVVTHDCSQLSLDVRRMLTSEVGKDVKLVADKDEFRVHSFILSARSPVFAAMFVHDTKEKITGRVVIEDIYTDELKALIHFLYTDEIPLEIADESVIGLIVAAGKYDIPCLQHVCEKHLEKKLTVENVLCILSAANVNNIPTVKNVCLQFFKSNATEVMASQFWKGCNDAEIIKVVCSFSIK